MPGTFKKYIKGWKRLNPGYTIKRWDETNFSPKECGYAQKAYKEKKYAFVSDYARYRVLYEYGGIYLDTDVELVRPLEKIISECERERINGFMGIESPETGCVAPGLICAAEKKNPVIRELLAGYKKKTFPDDKAALSTDNVVLYTTGFFRKRGLSGRDETQVIDGIRIYPSRYFNPRDMKTGKVHMTGDTVSIHHYAASWESGYSRFRGKVYRLIGRVFGKKMSAYARAVFGRQGDRS